MVGVVQSQDDLVGEVLVARLAPDPVVGNLLFVSLERFGKEKNTFIFSLMGTENWTQFYPQGCVKKHPKSEL